MIKLISLLMWTAAAFLTLILFFIHALILLLFPFDRQRRIAHRQWFWWADAVMALNPYAKLIVSGLENIDKEKAYVIVANHQSIADILVMYRIRAQFKWISKDSLFNIPFFGWSMMMTKYIRLTRDDSSSIQKVYRQAVQWLRKGMSLVFFPEGTRSKTGEMGVFQNGAFKLAIREKVPMLPIAITGTKDVLPKGSWELDQMKVTGRLMILPPIDTSGFKPEEFEKLRDITRSAMEKALCKA